jgi:hypothetical protein
VRDSRAMHRAAAAALALLATLAIAAAAAADARYDVDGPKTVRIGQEVRFPTTGLKPNEKVSVSLAPTINRGGNCCGIEVIRNARADANGEAILRFRWPRHYFNGDEKVRWRARAKADVIVFGDSGRGLRVVRVRPAR